MREMRPNEGGLLEGWVAYRVKTLLGEGREIEMPRYDLMALYLLGLTKVFGDFIREMKLLKTEAIILAETENLT